MIANGLYKKFLFLLILLLALVDIYSQSFSDNCLNDGVFLNQMPECNNNDYYVLFEDNFNIDSLDTAKWTLTAYGTGVESGIAQSQEFYTLDNLEISDGICKLQAKKENKMGKVVAWISNDEILEDGLPNYRMFYYTSSRLTAKDDIFSYGKYEIRCRLPDGKGFWPAFWMYSGPRWNELDFFDNMEGNQGFSCGPGYDYDGDGTAEGCRWGTTNIPDLSEWHTYTIYYNFDRIIWQIDGETIRTLYRYHTLSGLPVLCGDDIVTGLYFQKISFPIEPMHLIVNLAIRNGEEAPDENTVFPSYFEIDYIRYSVKPGQNLLVNRFLLGSVIVYPNPATNEIAANYSLNIDSEISISVMNMLGKEVLTLKNISGNSGKNMQIIDISNLPNGIYLIKIFAFDETITGKFIISK